MAEIRPFAAWRYNHFLTQNLTELTAPLSETMPEQRQAIFYQQPYHYYHLASPLDTPPYENAHRHTENWKLDKVIEKDSLAGIYVYRQQFFLKENNSLHTRLGFICLLKAEDFAQKIVLPHENTIQKAVEHRTKLLEATQMHTIPAHGFYTDKDLILEKYLQASIQNPLYSIKDKNDNLHQLSVIQDEKIIAEFIENLKNKQIWIADGHHRYESSVAYRKKQITDNQLISGEELFNYHLIWLTNTESSDLGVLPTHRLIHSLPDFDEQTLIEKLKTDFIFEELPDNQELGIAPCENLWTFWLILKSKNYCIRLKPESYSSFHTDLPEVVKALDLSVLHYFILEKALGLSGQKQFEFLDFSQYVSHCYQAVKNEKAQFALITRKITLSEIEKVIQSGYTMPAKTTFFFPKVLGGLVFADA